MRRGEFSWSCTSNGFVNHQLINKDFYNPSFESKCAHSSLSNVKMLLFFVHYEMQMEEEQKKSRRRTEEGCQTVVTQIKCFTIFGQSENQTLREESIFRLINNSNDYLKL